MTWIALIKGALSLISALVGMLRERQLLQAGEAMAIAQALEQTNAEIERVRRARLDTDNRKRVRDKWTDPE